MTPALSSPRAPVRSLVRQLRPAFAGFAAAVAVVAVARLLGLRPASPHADAARTASFAAFLFLTAALQPVPARPARRPWPRRLAFAGGLTAVLSALYYALLRAAV